MNKIKFGFLALLLGVTFASCDKNDYEYEPAEAVKSAYNIGFNSPETFAPMSVSDDKLEVELTREDATKELTVPIQKIDVPAFVTVPASATFKQGEKTTTIVLGIGQEMKPYVNYKVMIAIPQEYTSPFEEEPKAYIYDATITKEDFAVVAHCTFISTVALTGEWEADLEYSEYLKLYRIPALIADGYDYYFHFAINADGEQEFYFTDKNGKRATAFATGYVHPSYGMITSTINEGYDMGWDPEENEFYWVWKMTVSAGSFGENYQELVVNEWIKRPW